LETSSSSDNGSSDSDEKMDLLIIIKKLSNETLEMQQTLRNPKRGGTKGGFNRICCNNQEKVRTASNKDIIKDGSSLITLSATSRKRFLGKKSNTTTADEKMSWITTVKKFIR
jgi:hypothetical protein